MTYSQSDIASERTALLDCCRLFELDGASLCIRAAKEVATETGLPGVPAELSSEGLADHATSLGQAIRSAGQGDCSALDALFARLASFAALSGLGLPAWYRITGRCAALLSAGLVDAIAQEPARLVAAQTAVFGLLGRANSALGEADLQQREMLIRDARAEGALELIASERRFARLFESGLLCVLVCDLVGNIKDANDAFLTMVGYGRDEVLSGTVRWADMTPPEWRHLDEDAIEQLKATGLTRPWEKEYIRKDGTRVPILVGVAMLDDTECIAFALDISERRRSEELRSRAQELETQNSRIKEASRLKSEFLANMSHELRTPLNSIIGFADILHDGEISPSSPRHKEFLGEILKSGRHLLKLINDVLDLAKVEAGKIEFRPEAIDLEEIARDTWTVLRTIAIEKQIAVAIEIDPTVRQVVCDPARLKQVLYNYSSNALKFTGEGGRVAIRARPAGPGEFRIEVQDSGIGIAPGDLALLFVEFQQLDAGLAKRHQGTGLGLALTKRIVEAQGGAVGVESELGRGSTFYAVLPQQHAMAPMTFDAEIEFAPIDDRSAAVLVVEDDARDRRLLVQTLGRAGYAVEANATGEQAIDSCRRRVFDAVTLDLLLPDITGLEVLHSLRKDGKNRDTPVLVVSVVAERGIVGGYVVHDYLRKPINGNELLGSLARAGVMPGKAGTILVVDDDRNALKLMDAILGRLGYQADCRPDAESALSAASASRPAAVILDLLMPEVDGFEFLARFRRIPENRETPVIVWTMKDLTADDHVRLHRLAQAVVAKGKNPPSSVVEQLGLLLDPHRHREQGPL